LELLDEFNNKVVTRRKVNDDVSYGEDLNDTQKKILEVMKNRKDVNRLDIMIVLNLSRAAVTKNLKQLKDKGYIERIGSDKTGFYRVLK